MSTAVLKPIVIVLVPAVAPLLLALALLQGMVPFDPGAAALGWTPTVVLGVAFLLGWRFRISRLAFATVVLLATDVAVRSLSDASGLDGGTRAAITLLVPLNLVALAVVEDRGLFSGRALYYWLLLALQATGLAWMLAPVHGAPAVLADIPLPPALISVGPITAGQIASTLAVLALAVLLLRRRTALEGGLLGVLVLTALADSESPDAAAYVVYMSAAGLTLILTTLEITYTLAYRDELTGLPGRRALQLALARLHGDYVLAMVDIDHFKRFNDRFGHDVGDHVLRLVASRLARVGGGGRAYRYGGEEFTLVFQNRDIAVVRQHLEALRERIAKAPFSVRAADRPRKRPRHQAGRRRPNKNVQITVSIGAAPRTNKRPLSEEVLDLADKRLYRAKRKGRNRVEG